MSTKLKYHQILNVIKSEMSPKLKYKKKTEISPKPKCHQNLSITKTEISPKLKCHQNLNVTKTKNFLKIKFKIPKIGPDCLGLVLVNFKSSRINILVWAKGLALN